jgi:hypothetical protein
VAAIGAPVAVNELFESSVEETASEFVPEGIPHDGIHADQARREMADGKELHEFHVHQFCPGPECHRVGFASHVR